MTLHALSIAPPFGLTACIALPANQHNLHAPVRARALFLINALSAFGTLPVDVWDMPALRHVHLEHVSSAARYALLQLRPLLLTRAER